MTIVVVSNDDENSIPLFMWTIRKTEQPWIFVYRPRFTDSVSGSDTRQNSSTTKRPRVVLGL